ncbi:MAG: choice-of-anchor Q domain-containing protein [Bacteroidota bacterium]
MKQVYLLVIGFMMISCGSDDNGGIIEGCTDPLSQNFNPEATIDNNTCIFNADIDCSAVDFTFELGRGTLNGAVESIEPGAIIGIEAGSYDRIIFQNIVGTSDRPIVIINCGGKVTVGGPNANNGILFQNSKHFRLTGTGDADNKYGIFVAGSKDGSQGVAAARFSSNLEIDHIEIQKAGFAGIMVKSDPNCDPQTSAERGGPNKIGNQDFVMRDISIHDNYIHDVTGEGIYLGNSFYNGTNVYGCGVTQYPHEVRGVEINNNIVENAGWEAIQVGAAVEDVKVHSNIITDYGAANRSGQNGGIQVGIGTTGQVFNNLINKGKGPAVFIQGIGNNLVFNNVIRNAGTFGIIISNRPTPLASDVANQGFLGGVHIINNTIINSGDATLKESVNGASGNVFYNNLIITSQNNWDQFRGDTDWAREGNLVFTNVNGAGFVDAPNLNFGLSTGSTAINAGVDVSSFGINIDFEGNTRPSGTAYDVGAYESNE